MKINWLIGTTCHQERKSELKIDGTMKVRVIQKIS